MSTNDRRIAHCWKDQREHIEETEEPYSPEWCASWRGERAATCMLPDGHEGPHDFTPDAAIVVRFEPSGEGAQ